MRPIYRLPVIVHEGVRGRRASPRGSPRLGRRSSPRTSPNLRRRSQADSRSRSASPANIPALKVHGISLSRRFIRDTGLFRNLLAVCGSIDEEEVEKYLNKASLELVALIHKNHQVLQALPDAALETSLRTADYLLNDVVYYGVVEEIAQRLNLSRDLQPWQRLVAQSRTIFLDIAAHLSDLAAYFLMREGIISKAEYRHLAVLRRLAANVWPGSSHRCSLAQKKFSADAQVNADNEP